MPIFSKENGLGFRTTGIYGHWPKRKAGWVGYIALITPKYRYNFFYGMRNPFRPGKIIERFPNYYNERRKREQAS